MKRTAFIFVNTEKNNAINITLNITNIFLSYGINIVMENKLKNIFNNFLPSNLFYDFDNCMNLADFIVTIGGDGTIIHSAKYALEKDIPIIGVNAGRLGFLAQIEPSEVHLLPNIIEKNIIEKRMLLQAEVYSLDSVSIYTSFNEVLLSKDNMGKIIDIDVFCEDKIVGSYRADGIIFSTPIGSTAYAMSAGGPIIHPNIECISMTPICPHMMSSRSILFSKDKLLKAKSRFINNSDNIQLYIDGEKKDIINSNEYVIIKTSKFSSKFICFSDKDFYEILNKKIMKRGY